MIVMLKWDGMGQAGGSEGSDELAIRCALIAQYLTPFLSVRDSDYTSRFLHAFCTVCTLCLCQYDMI